MYRVPFTPFLLACNLLLALNLIVSCQQDAVPDLAPPKVTKDLAADDRMCPATFCEFSVTVDGAVDILLCGDISFSD